MMMKYLFLLILLNLPNCVGCDDHEYLPDCTSGNCVDTNINGSVYVKQTGEKLKNVPVTVFFGTNKLFDYKEVASGKTDKNGEFHFKVIIDTTFFDTYSLGVQITIPKKYQSDPPVYYESRSFYHYDPDTLQNINFEF